jgi:DNA-binding NarL/FixJ family response regulator
MSPTDCRSKRVEPEKKQLHLDSHLAKLAPREREALALMLDGHGNTEISKRMGIAYATAKQYKANILLKMNVQNMAEVIDLMRFSPPSWKATQEDVL